MKNTQSAGGVVVGADGRIILTEQTGGFFSLPKGHIKKGEDELTAAKREIYEETGILPEKLKFVKKIGHYQRTDFKKSELKTIHVFLFQTTAKRLRPVDRRNPRAIWVEPDKAAERMSHPKDKQYFEKIKKQITPK